MAGSPLRLASVLCLALAMGGCMRGCTSPRPPIHPNPNMDIQPKARAQAESAFFYDGMTMRQPLEHTVARGELVYDRAFEEGRDEDGDIIAKSPVPVDAALIARGSERYKIYCTPCHGEAADGRGMLYERAQIESGDLASDPRIVGLPDGQLFDVITHGQGLMKGYKYPIPPRDRWAIIAYLRTLQRGEGQGGGKDPT